MCNHTVNMLIPTFYQNFFKKELQGHTVCGKLGLCNYHHTLSDTDLFIQNLMNDSVPYNPPKINYDSPPLKFLFFNDIHADQKYQEGRSINCGEPLCCRTTIRMATSDSDKAKKWGSIGKCDLPGVLFMIRLLLITSWITY